MAHLDARLATLTGPGQALAQAETTVERLQQRAFEAIATVEQRAIDATANLERRAADTTTDLERRLDTFETQKQAIVQALAEATRVTDLVTALETHLVSLTGPDQALSRAEARVDQLQAHAADAAAAFERRAAETIADLERRIEGFDRQKRTIAQALAEAARVTDLVAAVDVHVATLTGPDSRPRARAGGGRRPRAAGRGSSDPAPAPRAQQRRPRAGDYDDRTAPVDRESGGPRHRHTHRHPLLAFCRRIRGPGCQCRARRLRVAQPRPARRNPERHAAGAERVGARGDVSAPGSENDPGLAPSAADGPGGACRRASRASLPSASAAPLSGIPSASVERRAPATSSSPSPEKPTPVRQAAAAPLPDATAGKRPAATTGRRGGPAARPARAVAATKKPGSQAASPQAVTATKDVKRFVGVLAVESVPIGAAVFIDQRPVGQTPLNLPDVRAGTHAIRVEHDGYARWTAAVLVSAGKHTRVTPLLQPIGPGPGANSGR